MSYQQDIMKLRSYAKGLGVKVVFKKVKRRNFDAAYDTSKKVPEIVVLATAPTRQILSLLHELGHHLDWVYRGKSEGYLESLPYYASAGEKTETGSKVLTKKQRGAVRKAEYNATLYMDQIHEECGLFIPKWKVYRDMITDRLVANYYYETGKEMTFSEVSKHQKRLTKKKVHDLWLDLYGVI